MITNAQNKKLSTRDAFIVDAGKKGFSPTEISILLKREGFSAPVRSRISQILTENGVNWRKKIM